MSEVAFRQFSLPGGERQSIRGADIASAATIAPTHMIHRITGTTQVDTITVPYPEFEGILILIATGAIVFSAAGNILLTFTMANQEAAWLVYDKVIGKWMGGITAPT